MNQCDFLYKNGAWVKFEMPDCPDFASAHRSPDGKVCGIYQRGQWRQTGDGQRIWLPAYIAVIDKNSPRGDNLAIYRDGQIHQVRVSPDQAVGLEEADPMIDAPYCRVAHLWAEHARELTLS